MPKIQMKTLACGPNGTYRPGETYEVADDVAADLIAGRFAALVDEGRSTEAPAAPDAPPADAPPADAPPADAPPADAPPADAPPADVPPANP